MTALSFFRIVPLHSRYLLFGFALAVAAGAATLVWDPTSGVRALLPLVVLQMFAAASGFDVPARRGHFDLLLTGGSGRAWIAIAHFVMSAAPGLVAWVLVAVVELAVSSGASRIALTSGSLAALAVVSMLAWAITVPLPRLSGGVIWLLLGVMAIAPGAAQPVLAADPRGLVLFPVAAIGHPLERGDVWSAGPAIGTAIAALAAAVWWIAHEDFPLEAAQ